MTQKILLQHTRAPGDVIVMTSVVRDLALQYGDRFQLGVDTKWPEIWEHNPHVTPMTTKPDRSIAIHRLEYREGIRVAGRGVHEHFVIGFKRAAERALGVSIKTTLPKPDLHLTPEELSTRLVDRPYWVVLAGSKEQRQVKFWDFTRYQELVDRLTVDGIHCVQAGANEAGHSHAMLTGVTRLVGQTNLRQFIKLIAQSEGVICPITAAMHLAAAFDKPCVVLAGGSEEPWWEWYGGYDNFDGAPPVAVPHRYLHTIGRLDCGLGNMQRGCWRKYLTPKRVRDRQRVCTRIETTPAGQLIPACMSMLSVDEVRDAVLSYGTAQTASVGSAQAVPTRPTAAPDSQGLPAPSGLIRLGFGSTRHLRAADAIAQSETPQKTLEKSPESLVRSEIRTLRAPANRPQCTVPDIAALDHPILGGRITFCTLLYGDHHELHKRCLESFASTVPRHRAQVRIGLNAVCEKTRRWLDGWRADWDDVRLYDHVENRLKYPVMREMFHQEPLTTPYVVWWDDDTYAVDKNWLGVLSQTIVDAHPLGYRLYGIVFKHRLHGEQEAAWFRSASWYRQRPFHTNRYAEAPNGDNLFFVSGGFLAIAMQTIYEGQIPDVRLVHNGGDICIGEQVHQAGGLIKDFNRDKKFVFSSGAPPRGESQPPATKVLLWRNR